MLQALSHYSYHVSSGQYTLCDLQGGVYRDGVILTDPVIHSVDRSYGSTDLGQEGMTTFFHGHVCNAYCKSSWTKPYSYQAFPKTASTSMAFARKAAIGHAYGGAYGRGPAHIPTAYGAGAGYMTQLQEDQYYDSDSDSD